MELQQVLRMKEGESPTSYAKNSSQMGELILKTRPFIENAIQEIMLTFKQPKRLNIADLGCSTGPNSLLPTTIIMDVIHETCQHLECACPELQVFLNDLPLNDFNSIFKAIPSFYKKISEEKGEEFGPCFVSAIPGSFYGRLFPKQSMHFVYSAHSLQWRSQVPPLLKGEKNEVNKGNVMLGKTSPQIVHKAYLELFQKDLIDFLKSRAEEIIDGGRMILNIIGREFLDPFKEESIWDALSLALKDLVDEGVVEEEKLNCFNIPIYEPHRDELEEVIKLEGSFKIIQLETAPWWSRIDNFPKLINTEWQVGIARAVLEPIIASHFGEIIIDDLFVKFKGHLKQRGFHDKVLHLVLLSRME